MVVTYKFKENFVKIRNLAADMIKSMTGYGKGEAILPSGKFTIEIRTLNGKSADISIKSSILPKERELEARQKIADSLVRGTIDVFLSFEAAAEQKSGVINADAVRSYCEQLKAIAGRDEMTDDILAAVLRLPDVIESKKADIIEEESWPLVDAALGQALDGVNLYREKEGKALYKDISSRIRNILDLENEVESHEAERLEAARANIVKAAAEIEAKLDPERFEQEMVFYLQKLDINEEKVRLRQHCKYFMETMDSDPCPGKKLGFIIQEMGREINTTGSKANNSAIQKSVVMMKDELEKIREQSMNVL